MSVTLTQYPTLAVPNRPVRIGFTLTTGNYVRAYITAAPTGSQYYQQLEKSAATQVLLHAAASRKHWLFTPDVAGRYRFAFQDISRGASQYGGRYYLDPDGYQTLTVNDETTDQPLLVGSRVQLPIAIGDHAATLRFYVWDSTCQATNVETHGELTPALVNPSTDRAEQASLDGDVSDAVAALAGEPAADILTDPYSAAAVLNHMITRFNTHCGSTSFHYTADSNNQLSDDYSDATDSHSLAEIAATLQAAMRRHMLNDLYDLATPDVGVGSGDFHQDGSSNNVGDWGNQPLAAAPTDTATAMVAIADMWRAYTAHRQWTDGHKTEDASVLLTLPLLLQVPRRFAEFIASADPTVPDTVNPGAARLAAEAGMSEG